MTLVTPKFGMGASVLRVEDQTFIKGLGRYTDDIKQQGLLHGYVLRSPVAKGSFRILSTDAAKAAPGVHLVLTGADIADLNPLRSGAMPRQPDGTKAPTRDIPILCRDRVQYVGDAVAFVVADTRALAQDAAELIEIEFDAEDAAPSAATALDEAHRSSGRNSAPIAPTPITSATGRRRRRLCRRGSCHADRIPQQPSRLQLHGGARRHGRVGPGQGPSRTDDRLAGRAFDAEDHCRSRSSASIRRSCA